MKAPGIRRHLLAALIVPLVAVSMSHPTTAAASPALDQQLVAVHQHLDVVVTAVRQWDGTDRAGVDPAALATDASAVATQMSELGSLLEADGVTKLASSTVATAERGLGSELQRLSKSLAGYSTAVSDHDTNAILDGRDAIDVGYDRFTPFYEHYTAQVVIRDNKAIAASTAAQSHDRLTRYAVYATGGLVVAGLLFKLASGRRRPKMAMAGGSPRNVPPVYKPVLASMPEVAGGEQSGLFGLAQHVDAAPLAGFGASPLPSQSFLAMDGPMPPPMAAPMPPVVNRPPMTLAAPVPPPPPVPIRGPMSVAPSSAAVPPPPPPAR